MRTPARKTITRIIVADPEQVKDSKNFSNKKPKLFLNHSLCPYHRMLYGRVKELARDFCRWYPSLYC